MKKINRTVPTAPPAGTGRGRYWLCERIEKGRQIERERERERTRQRYRERERDRDRERYRQRERDIYIYIYMCWRVSFGTTF